jgi:hypothetical protein
MKKIISIFFFTACIFSAAIAQRSDSMSSRDMATLRASKIYQGKPAVISISGYYKPGDGGNANYFWDDTSTHADDSALYIKPAGVTGAGRFRYLAKNNVYNLKELGGKADNTTDIVPLIKKILAANPKGAVFTIYAPSGAYRALSTMDFSNYAITLLGDGNNTASPYATRFLCTNDSSGIRYRANTGYQRAVFKGFILEGNRRQDTVFRLAHSGMIIQTPCSVIEVSCNDFSGHGVYVNGFIEQSTNASLCFFERLLLAQNNGSGIEFEGSDANQCTLVACDSRDNRRYGFEDNSFLGNQYLGCHANNCAKGPYLVSNANATATLLGCYSESGMPKALLNGNSCIIGGIHESGLQGGMAISGNRVYQHMGFQSSDPLNPQAGATIGFNGANMFLDGYGGFETGFQLRFRPQYFPDGVTINKNIIQYSMGYSNLDSEDRFWQLLGGGSQTQRTTNGVRGYGRTVNEATQYVRNLLIRGRLTDVEYDSIQSKINNIYHYQYHQGDEIRWAFNDGHSIEGWRCIKPGTTGVYTEGRTAFVSGLDGLGGSIITLNGNNTQIRIGDVILLNKTYEAVVTRFSEGANSKLVLDTPIPNLPGMKIEFATPKFKSFGNPSGTTSQRPKLRSDDAGQSYFDTTLGMPVWWNGNSWRKADGTKG